MKNHITIMKQKLTIVIALILILATSCTTDEQSLEQLIEQQMEFAIEQSTLMYESLPEGKLPRSIDPETGELITSGSGWWCSGFFPGVLWYLYNDTKDEELLSMAKSVTALIEKEQYNTGTHDLGFMINDSYGLGLKFAGVEGYNEVMVNGAYSLLSRYDETIGCIRSWDHGSWNFPVIIDNMMNLEFLVWAFRETGDSAFVNAVISHSDKTIENHFRADNSSFHVIDYENTGAILAKKTHQGYSDESAWSRGQAWGLYGFVSVFRELGEQRYLDQAIKIADFILAHPNLPDDKIPYWDFDAPEIPDTKRDASAGAIICAALLELQQYVDDDKAESYLNVAETILKTLSSPKYRANLGENGNFILKHSVGHLTGNSEVDVPLTYADYYFIESLLRMKDILEKE